MVRRTSHVRCKRTSGEKNERVLATRFSFVNITNRSMTHPSILPWSLLCASVKKRCCVIRVLVKLKQLLKSFPSAEKRRCSYTCPLLSHFKPAVPEHKENSRCLRTLSACDPYRAEPHVAPCRPTSSASV